MVWVERDEHTLGILLLYTLCCSKLAPICMAFQTNRQYNVDSLKEATCPMAYQAVLPANPTERCASFRAFVVNEHVTGGPVPASFELCAQVWSTGE